MAYVYILRSLKDGGYYYGSTEDREQRLRDHQMGMVRSTRGRRPLVLHYSEEFKTRGEAVSRERFFKSRKGYRWLIQEGIITRKSPVLQKDDGELAERLLSPGPATPARRDGSATPVKIALRRKG